MKTGIEIQIFVVNTHRQVWMKLLDYYKRYQSVSKVTHTQMDILEKMATGILAAPSEKQSKILNTLYEKAIDEGVVV